MVYSPYHLDFVFFGAMAEMPKYRPLIMVDTGLQGRGLALGLSLALCRDRLAFNSRRYATITSCKVEIKSKLDRQAAPFFTFWIIKLSNFARMNHRWLSAFSKAKQGNRELQEKFLCT